MLAIGDYSCATNLCVDRVSVIKEWADTLASRAQVLRPKNRAEKVAIKLNRANFSVAESLSICH